MTSRLRCLPTLLVASVLSTAALAGDAREEATIRTAAQATLRDYVEFLKIPNVMRQSAADMQRNAAFAVAAFKKRGFTARELEDGDTPMVFAEWPGGSSAKKTVLFYAHMDGQAVLAREWDQPDPFAPTLKVKSPDGTLKPLPIERLTDATPDREWRLFARSAADDKAPIMMLMAAAEALKAGGKQPAINIKILIDSHEEGGPPTLKDVVARNIDLLRADAVVMLDGPMHASNKPTVVFGHRGGGGFTLTVFGANAELHSGHYGNYAANPVFGLSTLIASMKDADGRVRIPGFYDGAEATPAMKQAFASVPDDEAALRARIGIAQNEKVGATYQEAINLPSLNITAIKAADIEKGRSIIPAQASASFDARTVPGTPAERQVALVRKWVEDQGYHLVDKVPTDEERRRYPRLAAMTGGGGGKALMTPLDSPLGAWAYKALRTEFGQEPVRIPMMGGSVPTAPLADGLKVPIILLPLVNNDNNQHATNENLRIGNFFDGVRSLYALYRQPL
jgi:acetylornithine deacetylase/succinyl-diaminopimelate desuccinylase-like protein